MPDHRIVEVTYEDPLYVSEERGECKVHDTEWNYLFRLPLSSKESSDALIVAVWRIASRYGDEAHAAGRRSMARDWRNLMNAAEIGEDKRPRG